ncbi:MAG: hypothetical protein ABI954_14520, partial [Pyrinomonadaceae bacterium]
IEERGAQIIRSGKATTRFVPSLAGTQAATKKLYFDPKLGEPQDLAGQVKYVRGCVARFNQLMTKAGYTPNDFADGDAMTYAIVYEAKYDRQADAQKLESIRNNSRRSILSSPYGQGMPSAIKQANYDFLATIAMQAYDFRIKARNAGSAAERREAEKEAQRFADSIIGAFEQ